MTHIEEDGFSGKVYDYLVEEYGEDNVESSKRLYESDVFDGESNRIVDFWVDGPVVDLAIEVENDFEACFKGTGQAIVYAAHELEASPVIIVPEGHREEPEASMLSQIVPIVEMNFVSEYQ